MRRAGRAISGAGRGASLLDGVTVLDFTRVLAGPYCTRLLADLGARVIKVERPGEGDETRRGLMQLEEGRDDQSTYFIRCNAGKLSVAVDLGHAEGRAVVGDLARIADVAVENFLPGVAASLACDYRTLSSIKPDLIYCSISGYGQTGPLRRRPAFAHIINAMSGVMCLEQEDDPHPRVAYLQSADVLAGTHACGVILAALLRRGRTGQGAYLDVSMLEALIGAEDIAFGCLLNGGAEHRGPRRGMVVHAIGDRHIATQVIGSPALWTRLVRLLDRPDLAQDPRFATYAARREHWPALKAIITEWLGRFATADEALEALDAARLPCAPVLTPAEVAAHPHLSARGVFPEVAHPARGRVRVTASPYHVDGRVVGPSGPAPYRVGEHTRAVLEGLLGYGPERVQALLQAGAIAAPPGPPTGASPGNGPGDSGPSRTRRAADTPGATRRS
jgi:formyl-CoA transferase/CoA:oxalate CoA-transferase